MIEMDDRWWELKEQPFRSDKPLVGRLLVWFRTLWNNVATRWYVIPLIQQQTNINHRLQTETAILREELRDRLQAEIASLREELIGEQEIRQVLDKEMVTTRRDQAAALYALQAEVARLRARLEEVE
jgi:hypothetical protein